MKIFVSCGSSNNIDEMYKYKSKELLDILGKSNDLVFGSYDSGLMGVSYHSFKNNIIGVSYKIYDEYTKDLNLSKKINVDTLGESIDNLIKESDSILVLPGAYGTISELMCSIELRRTINDKKIVLYNINNFYNDLINMFDKIYNEKFTENNYKELIKIASTKEEVLDYLKED